MALFAARGFLRFDSAVPESINRRFLEDIGHVPPSRVGSISRHYRRVMGSSAIPVVAAGTSLARAYPKGSAVADLLALPFVKGAIASLVGKRPVFDHHFLHIAFPPRFYEAAGETQVSQNLHQDSTIDPRRAFDLQIMYYPHAVTEDMGGTRFVPGTHLRVVSEASIGRYQNMAGQQHVVCPAGTLLFLHHGVWHGGGINRSDRLRYMFKIRMCPTERQVRLWDTSDLPPDHRAQRAIFWTDPSQDTASIDAILMRPEPWHEYDTGRLELMNRVRFWRHLLGDSTFDADFWLTRVENEPA
jgi:hypothetical protein